ncbi:hypothetical protein ACEVHA_028370 [Klebsiella pneumoniae]
MRAPNEHLPERSHGILETLIEGWRSGAGRCAGAGGLASGSAILGDTSVLGQNLPGAIVDRPPRRLLRNRRPARYRPGDAGIAATGAGGGPRRWCRERFAQRLFAGNTADFSPAFSAPIALRVVVTGSRRRNNRACPHAELVTFGKRILVAGYRRAPVVGRPAFRCSWHSVGSSSTISGCINSHQVIGSFRLILICQTTEAVHPSNIADSGCACREKIRLIIDVRIAGSQA